MINHFVHCLLVACLAAAAHAQTPSGILLEDDFRGLPQRMFSSGVVGAQAEYHFLPAMAQNGNWQVSCFRSEQSQRCWRVIADGAGGRAMYQSMTSSTKDAQYTHPMIVAGDPFWGDYTLEVEFTPESRKMQSAVIFRYQNDRCYYCLGVEGDQATLRMVNHASSVRTASITELGRQAFDWHPGRKLTATVTVEGDRIVAGLSGQELFDLRDATWTQGRIALMSDVPTVYHRVRVTAKPAAYEATMRAIREREQEEDRLQAANPQLKLWKKIDTPGFGTSRNLRFGDLNNDGQIDVLVAQVRRHGPKDRNSEVGCLTAMTFDGEILWQTGEADPWNDLLTNDVGVQVHDLDNDGRTEVIYARDFQLIVADGATGKVKYEAPTPVNNTTTKPYDKFPRILGDCLFFADFRGQGHAGDILIKDRYEQVFILTDKLEPLWQVTCNTGHYPFAYDIDHDGKDELAIGYNLYDHDGTLLWSREDVITDHADGVAIVNYSQKDGGDLWVMNAASDEGMIFMDIQGNILKRHWIGHVQNPTVANLRDDLPGLETVAVNFWGNQGITSYFDARGDLYLQHEPVQYGSMMLPVNWNGSNESLVLISADAVEGGMWDGWGRRVVRFPADGHPTLCNAVLDITSDCRDEIVVWDAGEIWIYTQDDHPKPGRLYRPQVNPLYNYSNYQATVSLSPPKTPSAAIILSHALADEAEVAELKLDCPQSHQVIQRTGVAPGTGFADVLVRGTLPGGADHAAWEYRVTALVDKSGDGNWIPLETKMEGTSFNGVARVAAGGWYRLEIRCRENDEVLAVGAIEPIGVGEVFVVAGQSYATNCNEKRLTVADPLGRVVAFNAAKQSWAIANDPQPAPDGSDGGSIWPPLGDALATELQVPIGLANVAVGATSSMQWLPNGNLHPRLVSVGQTLGRFRAVLWQQGESDVLAKTTTQQYVANLQTIRQSAAKAWGFEPPWLLAKSTHHPTVYHDPAGEGCIRSAIDELMKQPGFRAGPDTDTLTGENRGDAASRRHFSGVGQRRAAEMWLAAIRREIFSDQNTQPNSK